MFKVISDTMAHWYEMWSTIVFANSFCTGRKIIWALMFISYHYGSIKCLCNLIPLEPCNVMFKVIVFLICTGKKSICALMFIISNHYGIVICLSNLQKLQPCNVMFKGISYIMAHLHDLWNTIHIAIHFKENDMCIEV